MPDNDRVSIDNLTTAPDLSSSDVMPVVHEVSGVKSTFKATLTAIGTFINKILNYSADLQTTNKTVIGAINELHNGGGGGGSSNANIAPDYDSTATYVVGDWCIYNETLYQCNTAITIAEAFDPSHWTAKKIVDAFIDTTDYYGSLLPMSPSDPDFVADRITALESSKQDTLTTTSGTCTRNTTNTRSGNINYSKYGSVVTVGGYFTTKNTWSNTSTAVFELPYKSAVNLNPTAQTEIGGDKNKTTYLNVSNDLFSVRLDNSAEDSQLLRFCFSYITND